MMYLTGHFKGLYLEPQILHPSLRRQTLRAEFETENHAFLDTKSTF